VTRPSILLADEPTGNLDGGTGRNVLDLFERLRRDLGLTLVVATHDSAVAQRVHRELHLLDEHFVAPAHGPRNARERCPVYRQHPEGIAEVTR
jgi:putative ABC transport system ATP-binding protein